MKIMLKILLIIPILIITGCSSEFLKEKIVPKVESEFAKVYLNNLQNKNFNYIKQYIDPIIKKDANDEKLLEIADYFPTGELLSTELIGSKVSLFNDNWRGTFTFEYQFSNGWAVANVTLKRNDKDLSVIGFHVYQRDTSQKEINQFTLANKSVLQYTVLTLGIVIIFFTLITLYFCIKTPMQKKKWLWILFILTGIGSLGVNWTTGEYGTQFLSINLFASSAASSGPHSPWIFSISIPLGAILFWIKRKNFIEKTENKNTLLEEELSDSSNISIDPELIDNYVLASRLDRFIASFVDLFMLIVIFLVIMYFTSGLDSIFQSQESDFLSTTYIGLGTIVIFFTINLKLLFKQGQTIGKKLLGIRIVNIDNTLATKKQLINRYCFIFIPGYVPIIGKLFNIIDFLLIFGKERSCLHDRTANTKVIKVQNNIENIS